MGRDKVFLKLRGKTFLECIFANACCVFDNIVISTDTEEHKTQILKLPEIKKAKVRFEVIADAHERCGPIGGICTAFEMTDMEKFAIIPTDVPFADMQVLGFFYDKCKDKPIIYKRESGEEEPLVGAYCRNCYEVFKSAMDEGNFKMHRVLEEANFETMTKPQMIETVPELESVDFESAFANINRPEDYGRWVGDKDTK